MELHRPGPRRLAVRVGGLLAACLLALGSAAIPAHAQPAPDRPELRAGGARDYLFGRPRGSLAIRGSWLFASAGSDLFDFVTDQLTLERGDFDTPALAVDLDVALTERLDVVVGFEASSSSTPSEYRDYVDNNRLPITQRTSLRQLGFTGSVKYALTPRGRSISRLAWIPNGVTPFVGAGGGATKYDFKQTGDFVDFQTLGVFSDLFQSEGWAPSAHVFGGVDLRVFRRVYATVDLRYVWASADLQADFVGFDPIDLSGFRCGAGFRFVF